MGRTGRFSFALLVESRVEKSEQSRGGSCNHNWIQRRMAIVGISKRFLCSTKESWSVRTHRPVVCPCSVVGVVEVRSGDNTWMFSPS